jgi:hypothetical protein
MRTATLTRIDSSPLGTFGWFRDRDLQFRSLELPWHDNAPRISCIPPGTYLCRWHQSPSKGWVYRLDGTAPRSEILIHVGNWAGDVDHGFRTDSNGCILLGLTRGVIEGQMGIGRSRAALQQLADHFAQQDFELTITAVPA